MRPLVLYHASCWDGFCAAWLMWRHFPEDCEFRPVQYGEPPPEVEGREVYVLDFSYPRGTMISMEAKADSLMALDHHKTAREALLGLDFCRFSEKQSGGRMTWDFLVEERLVDENKRPWLVDYTEDRDLWLWALPDSKAVNASIRSYPLDFAVWDSLASTSQIDHVSDGEAILRAEGVMVADHIARAREVMLDGHKVLAVNATVLFSEIAGKLAEQSPSGIGVAWFLRDDHAVQFSLRSKDVDVSEIARAHGGGGHARAAGFEVGGLRDVWEVFR